MNNPANVTEAISLFVAMPYTNLGEYAKWPKVQNVEKFYEQVAVAIERKAGRKVILRIEKYAAKSGVVIEAMFRAILDSDVFIADLTGWNANVFFELGVRCSLSRKTTILTTQEDRPLPFDVSPMSSVRYANGPTQEAEDAIAQIVFDELDTNAVRSVVRSLAEIEVVSRKQWEIISGARIRSLLDAANAMTDPVEKFRHIQEAVETDPMSEAARIAQASALRATRQFEKGLIATEVALKLFRNSARLYKEKGQILDKMTDGKTDRLDDAIAAFQAALKFNDNDDDLHCCYGGALRRRGLRPDNPDRDRDLAASLLQYRLGMKLNRHSSYAGLNELRIRMLMPQSKRGDDGEMRAALEQMYYLCAFEVTNSMIERRAGHWWRMFDLADVHAFKADQEKALSTYSDAIQTIPVPERVDALVSPFRTWTELVEADRLEKPVRNNAELILDLLKPYVGPHLK